MWQPALAASILLVGQVVAGVVGDAGLLVRRIESVDADMRRFVEDTIAEPAIEKRQSLTPGPTMTVAEWDAQTMAACTTALGALNGKASNDAGMGVCYNLPFLDNSTGVFQADLRLFTISAPTGRFANISPQNVMVGLAYVGATVSPVNASAIGRRNEGGLRERADKVVSLISWPRSELSKRQATTPVMAQAYAFVGQINKDLLVANMDTASLEKLLVPQVTLTGMDSNNLQVNATLNTGEASFVSGVFATASVTKTNANAPIQTLVVASNAPFVLPGQNLLIAPIGGVITSIWALLLIGTIGYGTLGRMQFRDQYRRRSAMATRGNMARI